MSSIPDKYKELLHMAAADLKNLLWSEKEEDAKLVQKGLLLYRQGLVSKVRLEDEKILAVVQDVTRVHVELDLNFLQISHCSCPADGLCRHQIAAFLFVYAMVGSVSEWVESWRQPIQERKAAHTWGIQRAKDLLKTSGSMKPDYDRWVQRFQEGFESIMQATKNRKPYLVASLYEAYLRKLKAGAPVEQEWRQLYFLVASIHTFINLLRLSTENSYTEDEISRYYRGVFFTMIDDVEELVEKLNVQALPFAFDNFIEGLKNDSTKLVSENFVLEFERTHLYVILWTRLFKKKSWHEKELADLGRFEKTLPVLMATIHQCIMLREDEKALRLLHDLENFSTPFMIYWLEKLTAAKDWKRMGPYVEMFTAHAREYMQSLNEHYARIDFSRLAIRTVQAYANETKKTEAYERILIQTLPYSYHYYDEFLFDMGSYEKWCDLQAYLGFDLSSISTERIRFLQKEQPEILLPLYHQAIQQHIEMKNRGNYREAVKLLKKLRTIYKKLKRQDDWQQFLDLLLERTKRLRAFQQECERGKLHA